MDTIWAQEKLGGEKMAGKYTSGKGQMQWAEEGFNWVANSVVDPDPHGSASILVGWIRIRIQLRKITQNFTIFIC